MKTQFLNSKQGPIAFVDTGSNSQPMLFIHGFPTSKELFSLIMRHFKSEYRVIALDMLNYGESGRVNKHIEVKDRVEMLNEFITSLTLKNIILVGHDCGSSIAVGIMKRISKRINKLILMNSPVYPDFPIPVVVQLFRIPLLGFLILAIFKKIVLKESIERGMVNKAQYSQYIKHHLHRAFFGLPGITTLLRIVRWGDPADEFSEYPEIMKHITIPTLIIHGKDDPYIPLSHAGRMNEDIAKSHITIIENRSHFLPVDTPTEVLYAMRKFLRDEKRTATETVSVKQKSCRVMAAA